MALWSGDHPEPPHPEWEECKILRKKLRNLKDFLEVNNHVGDGFWEKFKEYEVQNA